MSAHCVRDNSATWFAACKKTKYSYICALFINNSMLVVRALVRKDTFLHGKVVLLVMLPLSLQVSKLEKQ